MKLKYKITAGFFIIAVLLFIAGAWSVIQVKFTGKNLRKTFNDNLTMIYEINNLNKSLQIKQKAFMLLLLDKKEEAKTLVLNSDSIFQSTLNRIKKSEKSKQVQKIISDIQINYNHTKELTAKLFQLNPDSPKEDYLLQLKKIMDNTNTAVSDFQLYYKERLNQLTEKIDIEENRSITPGLVAMTAAIIFSLLFSFFVNHYVVLPIVTITKKVNDFTEKGIPYDYRTETNDELNELSESIRRLTTRAEINRN